MQKCSAATERQLLGLRRTPGRLALAVFRMPSWLYSHGWGWTLGRTFLMLVHVGRKSGQSHNTVAMVLAEDADDSEIVICSAWGPDADWLQNLRARSCTGKSASPTTASHRNTGFSARTKPSRSPSTFGVATRDDFSCSGPCSGGVAFAATPPFASSCVAIPSSGCAQLPPATTGLVGCRIIGWLRQQR